MAEASRTGPEAAPVPGPLQCSVSVSGPRCGGEERGACTRIMIGDNDSWDPEHFKYHRYILDRIYSGRWGFIKQRALCLGKPSNIINKLRGYF